MAILGLVMDGLLLLFLAGTMIFAWHLSRNISVFRQSRHDMDKLVQNLGVQIEKAERATTGLKDLARQSGKDLQVMIDQAQALSDELQLMTESGDSLARRLERLADKPTSKMPPPAPPRETMRGPASPPVMSSFAIRDREVENNEEPMSTDEEFSKAERELMAALRAGAKPRKGNRP